MYFQIPTVNINFNPLNTSNQINSFLQNITNNAINSLHSPINNTENISNLPYESDSEEIIEESIVDNETSLLMYSDNILNFFEGANLD